MHEILVNRLGGLSLPKKSVVRLTDRPDMTLDVYRGRNTTKQQHRKITVRYSFIYRRGHTKSGELKWGRGGGQTGCEWTTIIDPAHTINFLRRNECIAH